MTFASSTDIVGRQPASILEIDLDACSLSYGVSPCTATLAFQNFAIRSEEYDNAVWGKNRVTINPNQDNNPVNGALTADEVLETTATGEHLVEDTITGFDVTKIITWAKHVKSNGRDVCELRLFNNASSANGLIARFDLANQTVLSKSQQNDGVILNAGVRALTNGYFRIWITGIPDTLGGVSDGLRIRINLVASAGGSVNYTGDATKGLFIFGAQLRDGLLPGKYAVTTSAAVDGLGEVSDLCFNTFGTCQDTPNYAKEVRTYSFVDAEVVRPTELIEAYPSIVSVNYGATRLQPGGRFSARGVVTVVLQDFAHNDVGTDDYQVERTQDQEDRGTFFGKLKERNKFYIGRPMRVREGYLDAPFSLTNFRTREYIIENITGPTADGKVTIEGKDILGLARDDRAKCPTASTGTVVGALSAGANSITVSTGDGAQYDPTTVDKHIRIDDEIILVNTRSGDTLTSVTRGQGGTIAVAHNSGASIQACKTYEDEPVIDVFQDLLENFANVPSSFIPFTDWEEEETASLAGYLMETIISTPTGVTKLIKEICESTLIDLWYSDVDQEIKLKLQTPFTEVTETWTDADNFVMDSVKVKDLNAMRLSRVLIYYGIRNFAEKLTEPENYEFINFEIEADKEGANKYDDEKIRTIFSRWFDSTNSVQVALTSQRLLGRFGITPAEISFDIDAKDVETLQTGEVFDVRTRVIQDVNGDPKITRFQILETKPKRIGSQYTYKALAFFQDPTPDSLVISSNDTDYDIFVELGGPPTAVDVTLTVNAAVEVDATNGNPAITTVGMHPDSTLHLINNGDIRGYGGSGSAGGSVSGFFEFEPGLGCLGNANGNDGASGQSGGDSIYTTIDITIDNTNGNIWAGAGGGGGGGADATFSAFGGGGGGGGGLGTDTGNAGGGGSSTVVGHGPGCGVTNTAGTAGTAGSDSAAGTGGTGGSSAGNGGAGGADWGDDGNAGATGAGQSGGSGGPGGFAVRLNGASIVWEGGNTAARVKGDVA